MGKTLTLMLIAVISLAGCTTMRPLETEQTRIDGELKPGDHLVIYETSGRILDMTYSHTDGTVIKGSLVENRHIPVTVNMEDIRKIEVERIDGARTTLAVVGGTIIAVPLLLIAALSGGMVLY